MFRLFVLLLITFPVFADEWNETAVVKAVGKPVSKKREMDLGCNVARYEFIKQSPELTLEFRCNRVNIYWERFKETGYEAQNQYAKDLAKKAAIALGGGVGSEIDKATNGMVFRKYTTWNGLAVNGSCSDISCLLTYSKQ
jgi:hypothetical protein